MTERKPREMSFRSWIDQQIADAEKRGVFDNLPGAGKPLPRRHGGGDYGQAWLRDYARREGVAAEEFLPTPLRLRREIERLKEAVPRMRSGEEVRDAVSDLNQRILQWRKIPMGPPIFVPLVKKEEMVSRWRVAQAARTASREAGAGAPVPGESAPSSPPPAVRRRRFRLRRRRSRSSSRLSVVPRVPPCRPVVPAGHPGRGEAKPQDHTRCWPPRPETARHQAPATGNKAGIGRYSWPGPVLRAVTRPSWIPRPAPPRRSRRRRTAPWRSASPAW